jgi:CHAD domain-containing protein
VGYRLHPGQPIAHEVVRIADRQLELGIDGLRAVGDRESDNAVHASRRHIKKIRALIRLVRPVLGGRYRTIDGRLRAINRMLAPIADGQAAVETLGKVAARYRHQLPPDAAAIIRAALVRRESIADEEAALNDVLNTAAGLLRAERDRVRHWTFSARGFHDVAPGLKRTARAARRAMKKTLITSRSGDYHRWRQRVKDQWLQVRLLEKRCGDALALDQRRLEALDGCLGDCHDCAILRDVLMSDSTLSRTDAAHALRLVRRYERELRRRARRLGATVHRETPKQFVARVQRLWRSARRTARPPRRGTSWRPAA